MANAWKQRLMQPVFDRYVSWRLRDLLAPSYPVILEYPIKPEPRYGYGKPAHPELLALLARNDSIYEQTLKAIAGFVDQMQSIPEVEVTDQPGAPCWDNKYFTALDAIALYGLLGLRNPPRYFEIGSGNSTKFARRAVGDLGLQTQILSVDPAPRAEVDALCDKVIRQPLEDLDVSLFDQLDAGDVLFVDNSHRVFQNSDVTVFFLEILPRLKAGVIIHIHDIFLPYDYPPVWADRHYSEQYLLASYLLGGSRQLETLLPLAYISQHARLAELVSRSWSDAMFQRTFDYNRRLTGGYAGVSCWLQRT